MSTRVNNIFAWQEAHECAKFLRSVKLTLGCYVVNKDEMWMIRADQ